MKRIFLIILIFVLILNSSVLISNCTSQWIQTNGVFGHVRSIANSNNNVFAGTSSGVYISTNNGTSWNISSLIYVYVYVIAINGENIFAGTGGNGIYLSTNNGTSWNTTNNGLIDLQVYSISFLGNDIYAGANTSIFKSTNNGISWSQLTGSPSGVFCFAIIGNNIFAGGANGVFRSTNNGINWTNLMGHPSSIRSFAVSGTYLFAADNGLGSYGIYLSTNNGANWWLTNSFGSQPPISSLSMNGTNLFAGTENGVYLTQNNGLSWIQKNQGFGSDKVITSLLIANNYIFAGTIDSSVWRRNLSEAIGIKQISEVVPSKYSLTQNYPNPFNPTTNIRFAIPKSSEVKITVYDISGKEAAVLVNEQLQAGTYQTDWDASKYASGVYFYRITAGDFTETKRMTLIK